VEKIYDGLRPADEILRDSEDFFAKRGKVHATLKKLALRLDREAIPYAVLGGMALNLLGYTRETVDIDLLMTGQALEAFRERLVGRGYTPGFSGAKKTFRDAETGVKIEILMTGEYPGDGRPKPVSFPDPARVAIERDGYRVVRLDKLIELKLASGLSAPHRTHIDLADVQRLIEELHLPLALADQLDPSVRSEYQHLWELAQRAREGPQERE
jgi:hypothetical protein